MNSALYGKTYPIPKGIINKLWVIVYNNPSGAGAKRAKNLAKTGHVTYQQLKRLKNFFDHFNPEENTQDEYECAGGEDMRYFVETTLERERGKTETHKEMMRPVMSLQGQRAMKQLQAQDGGVNLKENEEPLKDLKRNALAIIFNNDMEVLVLQRSSYEEQWMPNKWGLVGGGVEDGEEPIDAVKREIKEEIGLVIDKFIEKFVIQRNEDSVEHIFITKYSGNDDDVTLNEEHQDYKWCDVNHLKNMDSVPNLIDYVKIAIEKYE